MRPTELPTKVRKTKAKAGAAKGHTEGEKCRLIKETGPVKTDIPIAEVIKKKVQEAEPAV